MSTHVKVVLYGKEGTGKSALMMRYVYGRFDSSMESTIGAAFNTKLVMIDKTQLTLQIWDTAGSERFDSIVPIYIRGAAVVLLCFEEPTVSEIQTKIERIYEVTDDADVFLVATKMDEPKDEYTYKQLIDYATKNNYRLFYTSSLSGLGIDELFDQVARAALKATKRKTKVTISLDVEETPKKSCC